MADIDELLKGSFDRLAEPANSTGVADAIRARVAGGDTGVSVAGTAAPGWTPPRPRWFWPLLGTVIGLGAVLAVLIAVFLVPSAAQPVATATPTPRPTSSVTATPTPTPTPSPTENEEPPPPPARDTTSPKISAGQWSSAEVFSTGSTCTPTTADIVAIASDETRLADVSASSSAPGTTVQFVGSSGGQYTFRFSGTTQTDTQVTVTFTAIDDAGNTATTSRSILLRSSCTIIG